MTADIWIRGIPQYLSDWIRSLNVIAIEEKLTIADNKWRVDNRQHNQDILRYIPREPRQYQQQEYIQQRPFYENEAYRPTLTTYQQPQQPQAILQRPQPTIRTTPPSQQVAEDRFEEMMRRLEDFQINLYNHRPYESRERVSYRNMGSRRNQAPRQDHKDERRSGYVPRSEDRYRPENHPQDYQPRDYYEQTRVQRDYNRNQQQQSQPRPQPRQQTQQQQVRFEASKCYRCNEEGHYARNCPNSGPHAPV